MRENDRKLGRLITPDDGKVFIELYKRFLDEQKEDLKNLIAEAFTKPGVMEWSQALHYDLSEARNEKLIFDFGRANDSRRLNYSLPETGNCIFVKELVDASATLWVSYGEGYGPAEDFDLGISDYIKIPFKRLLLTNEAQPGKTLILIIGRGDIEREKTILTPTDLQAQRQEIIASTGTPLVAGKYYESEWFDAAMFTEMVLLSASDVASAGGGVKVWQSLNGEDPDYQTSYSTERQIINGVTKYVCGQRVDLVSRYVKVRYDNGDSNQSWFRLVALGRVV